MVQILTEEQESGKQTILCVKVILIDSLNASFPIYIYIYIYIKAPRGIIVVVVGNGHGDPSSNPGRGYLYSFASITLGKYKHPIILPLALGKQRSRIGYLTLEV